ncbi:MAG: NAD(P)/FAD-dependent oxidoreductase [Ruminococcaceae bacterium]|nr:NAD(P)/FAD-dependent oxidoreductase [Oscillospiraceae bacterium]
MNVVIIGAGPAGLTTAFELSKTKDYDIILLEQSDEVGGISKTVKTRENRMDIGGHRFFSKQSEVMDWWKNILPIQGEDSFDDKALGRKKQLSPNGPSPDTCDDVMLVRRRISRIYYNQHFFDYPISMKMQTFKNMGFVAMIKAGFSYSKSMLFKKPETNLENFYINRFGKVLYSIFFEGYTEKLWGRQPRDIAADWGSQRIKGLSILALIKDIFRKLFHIKGNVETSLIEEFWYPKYGPGHLWQRVASLAQENGVSILTGCTVKEIESASDKITAVKYEKDGRVLTLKADIVVSSMPLKDLINGFSSESAPEQIRRIANGLPYRDYVTVGLEVDALSLKNETDIPTLGNIVPDCWIYVQDTGVKLGRIQLFNNWSPYLVKDPHHTVWVGLEYFCDEGDDFWNMADAQCISFAIEELKKMGIINDATKIGHTHIERVQKAYPAYFDTYEEIDTLVDWLNGWENLYCVGRNGQHRYNNMDHSMITAFNTVEAIKNGTTDKSAIWNVNTEKEYHEEKNK